MAAKSRSSAKQQGSSGKRKPPPGKPWPKGVSGNPKGRPPVGQSLAEIVRKVGDEYDPKKRATRIEAVVRAMFKAAAHPNLTGVKAAGWIADRGWGKTPQPIEIDWRTEAMKAGYSPEQIEQMITKMMAALEGTNAA